MQSLLIAIRGFLKGGTDVAKFLNLHSMPPDFKAFALKHKTLDEVWTHSPRADWLLRMLDCIHLVPPQKMRQFACSCARQVSRQFQDPRSIEILRFVEAANEGEVAWHDVSAPRSAAYQALADVQGKGDKLTEELTWTAYSVAKDDAYTACYDACVHSMEALKIMHGKDAKQYIKRQADSLRTHIGRPFEVFRV